MGSSGGGTSGQLWSSVGLVSAHSSGSGQSLAVSAAVNCLLKLSSANVSSCLTSVE